MKSNSADHALQTTAHSDAVTSPSIGVLGATALVIGSTIGSGVFFLPSTLAPFGAASLLGWAVTLVGALALAFVFASLTRESPAHGGAYAYARAAFGDGMGFLVAWSYWVCMWCGNAAIAVAFAGGVSFVFPTVGASPVLGAITALAALWTCTLINIRGVKAADITQIITTIIKLIPLIVFGLFGWAFVTAEHFQPFNPTDQSLMQVTTSVASLTLWAFLGLEAATIPSKSIRNPSTTIPTATLLGICIAGFATLLACTAVLGLVPREVLQNSPAPMAEAAQLLWGAGAGKALGIFAAISCFGALNGWVMLQAQVPLAAANDGLFPPIFKRVDRQGIPVFGLLISTVLASVLVIANFNQSLVTLFKFSILLATASVLIPYAAASLAWMSRNFSRPESFNGWRNVGAWFITAIALSYSIWAFIGVGSEAHVWCAGLLLSGLPVYTWLVWPKK